MPYRSPATPALAAIPRWAIASALGCSMLLGVGCRQPVTQPNGAGGTASLFQRNPQLAGNQGAVGSSGFAGSSPFATGNMTAPPAMDNQQAAQLASQYQNLNQRLSAYDTDNQLLNTELAALKQKLELSNQYGQQLKQQLADTTSRVRESEQARQAAVEQLAEARAQMQQWQQSSGGGRLAGFDNGSPPSRLAGGATIGANNGIRDRLPEIQIPGGQARLDGDVIRIEIPSERLFTPGTYQIQPSQLPALQTIVRTIRQSFPRQIVGIESHWDNTPLNPATISHHQYTATQALAVFERLVALGVPRQQLFTMAMGSNRPRHAKQIADGIHPNRRIEIVIYPETWDAESSNP